MTTLVNRLGNKEPGLLIKSNDWNALVDEVDHLGTRATNLETRATDLESRATNLESRATNLENRAANLETRATNLETRAANLESRTTALEALIPTINNLVTTVGNLQTQVNSLQAQVQSLMGQYYQVTMETARSSYAIGELAEITATVHNLQGERLSFGAVASRPWIDFMTVWGQLHPIPGFTVRGGAGNKTLSVQVNAEGIARVSLRSEFSEDFEEGDQTAVATSLTTNLQAINMTVAQKIVAANTPQEARIDGAFRALSLEYDRTDTDTMRRYVDAHFIKNPAFFTGRLTPNRFVNWRDYRATVVAFAKRDSDPLTPDFTQGASSIQVTFRDWIGPWITLEYLPEIDNRLDDLIGRLNPRITENVRDSIDQVRDEVINIVRGTGVIGKIQKYTGVRNALNRLTGDPDILVNVVESVGDAIDLQIAETSKPSAFGALREDREFALEAQTRSAARAEQKIAGVQANIDQVDANLDARVNDSVTVHIAELESAGGALDGIRQQLVNVGGRVDQILTEVDTVGGIGEITFRAQQIRQLDNLYVDLDNRVNQLLGR